MSGNLDVIACNFSSLVDEIFRHIARQGINSLSDYDSCRVRQTP